VSQLPTLSLPLIALSTEHIICPYYSFVVAMQTQMYREICVVTKQGPPHGDEEPAPGPFTTSDIRFHNHTCSATISFSRMMRSRSQPSSACLACSATTSAASGVVPVASGSAENPGAGVLDTVDCDSGVGSVGGTVCAAGLA